MRLNSITACVWRSLWAIGCTTFPDQRMLSAISTESLRTSGQPHPVVVRVFALVAVDEYEVEHTAQSGSYIQRRTDVEPDAGAVRAAVEERLRQLFQFVFNLDGMQFGLPFQPCGHAEGRVTRESPDFEHPPRA